MGRNPTSTAIHISLVQPSRRYVAVYLLKRQVVKSWDASGHEAVKFGVFATERQRWSSYKVPRTHNAVLAGCRKLFLCPANPIRSWNRVSSPWKPWDIRGFRPRRFFPWFGSFRPASSGHFNFALFTREAGSCRSLSKWPWSMRPYLSNVIYRMESLEIESIIDVQVSIGKIARENLSPAGWGGLWWPISGRHVVLLQRELICRLSVFELSDGWGKKGKRGRRRRQRR